MTLEQHTPLQRRISSLLQEATKNLHRSVGAQSTNDLISEGYQEGLINAYTEVLKLLGEKSVSIVLQGGCKLELEVNAGGGTIVSPLERDLCSVCGKPDCCYTCPEANDTVGYTGSRLMYNGFLDALESITLAHACAGIDVSSPKYVQGLDTALTAAGNNYG